MPVNPTRIRHRQAAGRGGFVLPPSPARSTDSQFDTLSQLDNAKQQPLVMESNNASKSSLILSFPFSSDEDDKSSKSDRSAKREFPESALRPIFRQAKQATDENDNDRSQVPDIWMIRRCHAFDEDDDDDDSAWY